MKVEGGRAGKDNSESFFFFIQLICCCCFLQNLSGIFFSVYCVSQHFTESDLKDALKHLSWCSLNYSNIFRMQMRCVVKVTLKQPVTFFFFFIPTSCARMDVRLCYLMGLQYSRKSIVEILQLPLWIADVSKEQDFDITSVVLFLDAPAHALPCPLNTVEFILFFYYYSGQLCVIRNEGFSVFYLF